MTACGARHSGSRIEDAKKIDAVEVINARCVFNRSNVMANTYADTYHLSKVGGSDAHFGAEIANAGTLVPEGEDVREAILKKHTMAFGRCSTPLFHVLHDGAADGKARYRAQAAIQQ